MSPLESAVDKVLHRCLNTLLNRQSQRYIYFTLLFVTEACQLSQDFYF